MLKVVARTMTSKNKLGCPLASDNDSTKRNTVIATF